MLFSSLRNALDMIINIGTQVIVKNKTNILELM